MFESGLNRIYQDIGLFGVVLLSVYILFVLFEVVFGLYHLYKIHKDGDLH